MSTLVQMQEGTRSEICIIITDESEREQTWLVAVNRIINHHQPGLDQQHRHHRGRRRRAHHH